MMSAGDGRAAGRAGPAPPVWPRRRGRPRRWTDGRVTHAKGQQGTVRSRSPARPGAAAVPRPPPSAGRSGCIQHGLEGHGAGGGGSRAAGHPRARPASPITQKGLRANLSRPLQPRYRQQQPAAQMRTKYSTPNTTMVTISCRRGHGHHPQAGSGQGPGRPSQCWGGPAHVSWCPWGVLPMSAGGGTEGQAEGRSQVTARGCGLYVACGPRARAQGGRGREGSSEVGVDTDQPPPPSPTATKTFRCGCHGARPCLSFAVSFSAPAPHPRPPGNTPHLPGRGPPGPSALVTGGGLSDAAGAQGGAAGWAGCWGEAGGRWVLQGR